MADHHNSLLAFAFILNILFSSVGFAIAGRDVPTNTRKTMNNKKLEPELFHHHDPTVLVPGFGRYMHPKKFLHCKHPLKYNAVTGACTGTDHIIPGRRTVGGTGRRYIPGGDDTFVPNPGFEVPIPGNGGGGYTTPGNARP